MLLGTEPSTVREEKKKSTIKERHTLRQNVSDKSDTENDIVLDTVHARVLFQPLNPRLRQRIPILPSLVNARQENNPH